MTNQTAINQRILSLPEITTHDHQFGGTEYRLGKREIGHYHDDLDLVDIPFPRRVRDEVVDAGLAEPHHVFPNSGWVSKWLREPRDVNQAIALLERSYELARAQAERQKQRRQSG